MKQSVPRYDESKVSALNNFSTVRNQVRYIYYKVEFMSLTRKIEKIYLAFFPSIKNFLIFTQKDTFLGVFFTLL